MFLIIFLFPVLSFDFCVRFSREKILIGWRLYQYGERETDRQKGMFKEFISGIYFKELAHVVARTIRSKIYRAGQQARNSSKN